MGVLTNNINQPSDAQIAANRIIGQTQSTFNSMVHSFNEGSRYFWKNPKGLSPQQIANELGNNAKEIFELHYALGQFINSVKPGSINEGLSLIGQFTMNNDGTVTILNN